MSTRIPVQERFDWEDGYSPWPPRRPSLVEILVIVAIICILAGILLPVFSSITEQAAEAQTISAFHTLDRALNEYIFQHKGRMPLLKTPAELERALGPYLPPTPPDNPHAAPLVFATNPALSGRQRADVPHPEQMVVAYQVRPDRLEYRCVLFLTGRVRLIAEREWPSVRQASGLTPAAVTPPPTDATPRPAR